MKKNELLSKDLKRYSSKKEMPKFQVYFRKLQSQYKSNNNCMFFIWGGGIKTNLCMLIQTT